MSDINNTPSPSTGEGRDGGEQSLNPSPTKSEQEAFTPAQPNGRFQTQSENKPAHETEEKNTHDYGPNDPDPDLDCYYEPLNPEQLAILDYEMLLESGEFTEDEISIALPSPDAWKAFHEMLAHMKEAAAAEGVPLLPNPLAARLHAPAIRSP